MFPKDGMQALDHGGHTLLHKLGKHDDQCNYECDEGTGEYREEDAAYNHGHSSVDIPHIIMAVDLVNGPWRQYLVCVLRVCGRGDRICEFVSV